MNKEFGKVALLVGGDTPEREVSLSSAQMVGRELELLCEEVVRFDPRDRDLTELHALQVDCAFIILHGGSGEDGRMQAALEMLGIPYTGPRHLACALAMDKTLSKQMWYHAGLPTAAWETVSDASDATLDKIELALGRDVFVKPNQGGSSNATQRACDRAGVTAAIQAALKQDDKVLVEQTVEGIELTYGIVGDQLLPGIRIEVDSGFYDYAAKYKLDTTRYICPPQLPRKLDSYAQQLARDAYRALQCSGWGRVDLMLSGHDFYLLEINTVPGMTDHSLVPQAAAAAGISNTELIRRILQLAA